MNWELVPASLTLSNGALIFRDATPTNEAQRFFRAYREP